MLTENWKQVELFYLNTIEQLFLFVEQFDQLEVCLPLADRGVAAALNLCDAATI